METIFKDQEEFAKYVYERFTESGKSQKEFCDKLVKSRSAVSLALSATMYQRTSLNKLRFEILYYLGFEAGKAIFVNKM